MKITMFIALKSFGTKQLANSEFSCKMSSRMSCKQASQTILEARSASYGQQSIERKYEALTKAPSLASIALPKKQSNYTVLRSPHIDKKSRDQFALKVHKRLILVRTEIKELRKQLFNLKFHEIPGVQMKVIFHTKTRLNPSCF
jgi:ribosomal protein S10